MGVWKVLNELGLWRLVLNPDLKNTQIPNISFLDCYHQEDVRMEMTFGSFLIFIYTYYS